MSLIATPGAANADSYATLAEALAYNASRPFATEWADSDDATREAALKQAALLLDASFRWTGVAADEVQALTWPRVGMLTRNGFAIASTVIPKDLKNAQSEFARQLLIANRASDDDAQKQNIEKVKAGSVEVTFKKTLAGSAPQDPYAALDADVRRQGSDFDYLSRVIPDVVRLLIPPSWYVQATVGITSGLIFEVDR